jgi:phosphonate transport system substrate-binding protein
VRTIALAILASLVACRKRDETQAVERKLHTFKFTAIPNEKTVELREKFAPLEKYLSERLGVRVEYVPTTDYNASVDAFVNTDVHLAWFGGLTGVRAAAAVPGARAIAQGKSDPQYRTYFVAHRSAGLAPSEEFPQALAGRRFTFGSDSSTSGRLMPEYFLRKFTGKTPRDFFGAEMNFSGSHDKTAQLVQAGTFEAGALDFKSYERMVAEGKIDPEVCRVIWKSPPFADYHFLAHPELDRLFGAGFIDRLQTALVEIQEPALLDAINRREGLIPAHNEQWNELRNLARELRLLR